MITPRKIEEWLEEVEARPASARLIVKHIADRLKDLSARCEELLAENIALQSGEKTEEYKERIAHLEFQLDLLKRRYGRLEGESAPASSPPEAPGITDLLIYSPQGRILRIELGEKPDLSDLSTRSLQGDFQVPDEPVRILMVPSQDELLFLFSTGRVSTHLVSELASVTGEGSWEWNDAALPEQVHPGERLVSLVPIAGLPLADFFLQASRRGCVKKTLTSLSQGILSNHFLGRGTLQKADQPFELVMGHKGEVFVLVTYEGNLVGLDVDSLSYSLEEKIRLSATDHLVASFVIHPDESLLLLTQTGKVLHRTFDYLETTTSPQTKGQAWIPASRREQGARAIGAAALHSTDRLVLLDSAGSLFFHEASRLTGAGAVELEHELVAFTVYPGGK